MNRKEQLLKTIENDISLIPLVDEMVFLEEQLEEIKKLPFLKVHPQNKELQKATPAAKQYKELLQQYTNIVRIMIRATNTDIDDKKSPLRDWLEKRNELNE